MGGNEAKAIFGESALEGLPDLGADREQEVRRACQDGSAGAEVRSPRTSCPDASGGVSRN
jgi:hypothetical protein